MDSFAEIGKRIYINLFGETHIARWIRFRAVTGVLKRYKISPKIILDAGCGDGRYSFWLSRLFPDAEIFACDFSPEAMEKVPKWVKKKRISFFICNLSGPGFAEEKFDLIVSVDVLEHVWEDKKAIQNLAGGLKKDGFLAIHTPRTEWDYLHFLKRPVQADHVRDGYDPAELKKMAENEGLAVVTFQYTSKFFGSMAREIGVLIEENKLLRFLLFPLLRIISKMDSLCPENKGNDVLILAQKR